MLFTRGEPDTLGGLVRGIDEDLVDGGRKVDLDRGLLLGDLEERRGDPETYQDGGGVSALNSLGI